MSVHAVTAVWNHSQQTGSALLMLLAIADHANADGVCWPSIPRLAAMVRVSERQAKRLILQLQESGELEIESRRGRGHTNFYYVTLARKGDTSDTFFHENSDTSDTFFPPTKGDIQGKKVTSRVIKGDTAMAYDPLEPSIEPYNDDASSPAPISQNEKSPKREAPPSKTRKGDIHDASSHTTGNGTSSSPPKPKPRTSELEAIYTTTITDLGLLPQKRDARSVLDWLVSERVTDEELTQAIQRAIGDFHPPQSKAYYWHIVKVPDAVKSLRGERRAQAASAEAVFLPGSGFVKRSRA